MTDIVLSLVPQYGLYIVGFTVLLATLGIPLPSSVVMVTSGGLAATGDLLLPNLLLVSLLAFITGDQLAYLIGAKAGPEWLDRMRQKKRFAGLVDKGENMYSKFGSSAVLLSRTVLSPTGPCIAYLSGASGMSHVRFSLLAGLGALIWTSAYGALGYLFAGNVPEISDLVSSALMVAVALLFVIGFAIWLSIAWRGFEKPVG